MNYLPNQDEWPGYDHLIDNLPELTDGERAVLDSIPDDAVSHWFQGEKWDFEKKKWILTPPHK